MKWTKEQQNVIDFRNRDILVSAAAGSGKQRCLWHVLSKEFLIRRIRLISTAFGCDIYEGSGGGDAGAYRGCH